MTTKAEERARMTALPMKTDRTLTYYSDLLHAHLPCDLQCPPCTLAQAYGKSSIRCLSKSRACVLKARLLHVSSHLESIPLRELSSVYHHSAKGSLFAHQTANLSLNFVSSQSTTFHSSTKCVLNFSGAWAGRQPSDRAASAFVLELL